MSKIAIRRLTTMEELKQMQSVEEQVWSQPPTPTHQTFTTSKNGGVILGAYKDDVLIGFVYSFPGFDRQHTYLHSHMLGTLPEYRQGGIGEMLKLEQANIAKSLGYTMMTWTFDPLESINAYLNINKLRAVGAYYEENYYEQLRDGLNQGLPTDRILIQWDLRQDRPLPKSKINEEHILLIRESDGSPAFTQTFLHAFNNEQREWFVGIPEDFQTIKQHDMFLAKQWRLHSRKVFNQLFSAHYQAVNIIRDHHTKQSYYVFEKNDI